LLCHIVHEMSQTKKNLHKPNMPSLKGNDHCIKVVMKINLGSKRNIILESDINHQQTHKKSKYITLLIIGDFNWLLTLIKSFPDSHHAHEGINIIRKITHVKVKISENLLNYKTTLLIFNLGMENAIQRM